MSAKLTFNGVEIAVPVAELAEAMKQLALVGQHAAKVTPKPNGSGDQGRPVQKVNGVVAHATNGPEDKALLLLQLLVDHKMSGGVSSDEVQRVLGVSHPKGIGSRVVPINALLRTAGFNPEDVYSNTLRDEHTNGRIWQAGEKIMEALQHIKSL